MAGEIAEVQLAGIRRPASPFTRPWPRADNPYVHAALASFYALSGEWVDERVHVDQLRKRTPTTSEWAGSLEFNRGLDNQPLPGRLGEGLRLALQASPECFIDQRCAFPIEQRDDQRRDRFADPRSISPRADGCGKPQFSGAINTRLGPFRFFTIGMVAGGLGKGP